MLLLVVEEGHQILDYTGVLNLTRIQMKILVVVRKFGLSQLWL